MSAARILQLAALLLWSAVAILAFASTDLTTDHLIGILAAGLACLAAAPLAG